MLTYTTDCWRACRLKLYVCLCTLQSLVVHWEMSAWRDVLWAKRCSWAWYSWLYLDLSCLSWCGWRRNTRERGTHWREAVWPRANTPMWWDHLWLKCKFVFSRICLWISSEIFSTVYVPIELTVVPTGELFIFSCCSSSFSSWFPVLLLYKLLLSKPFIVWLLSVE